MIPSYTTTCLLKTVIAPGVYEFRMHKPEGFGFAPGQFVLFDVPLAENKDDIQPRAYSIASAPFEPDLLFVIKLVPGGRASAWFESQVVAGTTVTMKGPFGAFTTDAQTEKSYLFIATGTGIAPLRSQILHALQERNDTRPMRVAFGVRSACDLFWMDAWKRLEREYENLHVHAFVYELDGPMQEKIPELVEDFGAVSAYICGAPETVRDIKSRCLQWGILKNDVHAESYM